MPQRTCLTRAEWEAREKSGLEGVDEFSRRQSEVSGLGNN
jgi:hypothetical protein